MALGNILAAASGAGSLGTLFVKLTADATNLTRGMNEAELSVSRGSSRMLGIVKNLSIGIAGAYAVIGAAAVKEAATFESSFAGVRKTIDATEAEFQKLSDSFRQMARELPINVNEINSVAEAAGQLGIQKSHLESFTKTMIDLGKTTNLSSTEAATQLARLANITQMPQTEFDRLGSTIVALGNNLATTEAEIVGMALRLAGAGKQVGLTEDQIVSFAAALSSVGVEAEAGGTAMSQAMIKMAKAVKTGSEELEIFASVAGMTSEEFVRVFEKDATGAILTFLKGLKSLSDQGEDVFTLLNQMGIDGIRLTDVMLRASGSGDLFAKSMRIGSKAFEENNALTEEARKRYETFTSELTVSWNRIKDVAISIGQSLTPALKILNQTFQNSTNDQEAFARQSKAIGDYFAGPFLFIVGKVGDVIQGWSVILKTVQIEFARTSATTLAIMSKMVQVQIGLIEKLVNANFAATNALIRGINKQFDSLPEWMRLAAPDIKLKELQFKVDVDMSDVEALAAGFDATRKELEAELGDMFEEGRFSTNFKEKSDEMVKEIAESSKDLVGGTLEEMRAMWQESIDKGKELTNVVTLPNRINKQHEEQAAKILGSLPTPFVGPTGMQGVDQNTMQGLGMAQEMQSSEEALKVLQDLQNQKLELTKETNDKMLALQASYLENIRQLRQAELDLALYSAMQIGEGLVSITKDLAGEQSTIYKAMFAASKAFAIADAIVKIQQGVANAAVLPWPANLAAIGSVIAATANIVSTIQATKLEFGGGRATGGPVSPDKAFIVGEKGPEMFVPSKAGTIVPNDRLSGGSNPIKVIVNNFTDARPEVKQSSDNGQQVIEVVVRRVKDEMATEIREGRGPVPKAMETTFGLRRGRV